MAATLTGAGAKGQRYYDWSLNSHHDPAGPADPTDTQRSKPLVRRHCCYAPEPVPLRELVRVACRRRTVEESFQVGKGWPGSMSTGSGAGGPGGVGPCSPWPRPPCSR